MKNTPQFSQEELVTLVKESEDILTPLLEEAMPAPQPCPNCGSKTVCIVDPHNPFTPGKLLQNFILQCPACWTHISS